MVWQKTVINFAPQSLNSQNETTSTISFSNQNDEPETRQFVYRFEKTKRQNVVFFIVFKNAAQHYIIFFPS